MHKPTEHKPCTAVQCRNSTNNSSAIKYFVLPYQRPMIRYVLKYKYIFINVKYSVPLKNNLLKLLNNFTTCDALPLKQTNWVLLIIYKLKPYHLTSLCNMSSMKRMQLCELNLDEILKFGETIVRQNCVSKNAFSGSVFVKSIFFENIFGKSVFSKCVFDESSGCTTNIYE